MVKARSLAEIAATPSVVGPEDDIGNECIAVVTIFNVERSQQGAMYFFISDYKSLT